MAMNLETTVFEIIEVCQVGETVNKGVASKVDDQYRSLLKIARSYSTADDFLSALVPGETKYMEAHFAEDKSAKFPEKSRAAKAGQWKFSKLPKSYRTAKSVISTSLSLGILPPDDVGKSVLDKRISEARKKPTLVSLIERVKTNRETFIRLWHGRKLEKSEAINAGDIINLLNELDSFYTWVKDAKDEL